MKAAAVFYYLVKYMSLIESVVLRPFDGEIRVCHNSSFLAQIARASFV